ncbi:MAG TPA: efflux RND transporter permease subunit [Bryobacteraceae bacterium]|nr:efflux RND transporter permease subunit [Bryobacteraceae bacterium]
MRIAELCVKRPVFAVMLVSFLVVLGLFSFRDLGVDLFPRADPAVVNVVVVLKGATPEEVNTQLILPLEEALSSVSGMDELSTQATEGNARLICRFNLERDINGAAQDVREKVAAAIHLLPPTIEPPVIVKVDPDSDPILTMLVGGTGSLRETTEIADKQVLRALETVNGVGAVNLSGGKLRQIRVFADAEKLNAFGITIKQLETAIQKENVEVPGGVVRQGPYELGLRTLGRIESPAQFNDIIVANLRGAPIRVRDVGRVEDSYPDTTSWNRLHGKEAVVLAVQRQFGTNTLDVIDGVKAKLEQLKSTLPPGAFVEIIRDNSTFIKASVKSLEEHLLFGSVLASLVVLLFLRNWRPVLIAALAIPTSIIATFTLLRAMNFTLNNMTLLGLTLSVGIVIDDAIVVLENIVRYVQEKGYEPKGAAIAATREIMLAVMATTLSLVIIFVPIAFTTGYARRYLNQFGWTMACAVVVSMLVSFTLTPMLSSRLLKRIGGRRAAGGGLVDNGGLARPGGFFQWIDRRYGRMLEWSLDHRPLVILVALATFGMTFYLNRLVGRDFIPADDQNEFQAIFESPVDSSLEGSAAFASDLAARYEQVPGVLFAWPNISERESHSHTYIRLTPATERKFTYSDVADQIRKIWAEPRYKNLRTKFWFPSALGGGENTGAIQPMILGPDFNKAASLASQIAGKMRRIPGLLDVSAEINLNGPEFDVDIDRERAADLGVQVSDAADAVRLMIDGTDQISTYKEGAEQYDVTMQLLPEQQRNPAILARLMVPSSTQGQVRLDSFASIRRGSGPTRIDRYNRIYQAGMVANQAPDMPLDAAVRAMSATARKDLPPGYSIRFTGTAKELDRTTNDLIVAFLLACIFMYMVLAAQFESFLHPFVIMLSLPLAVPFALLTLYLTHRTLNLWSALGMLLLLGIVKKNGILQVDYANRLLAQGAPLREAILQANHVRLRPILMTTTSIVAGLLPTALGLGAGGTQRAAIAVTIIGGQSLCLLLTLLVTPVAYSLLAGVQFRQLFAPVHASWARMRLGMARVFTLHVR